MPAIQEILEILPAAINAVGYNTHETPLDHAKAGNHPTMVAYLRSKGGKTARELGVSRGGQFGAGVPNGLPQFDMGMPDGGRFDNFPQFGAGMPNGLPQFDTEMPGGGQFDNFPQFGAGMPNGLPQFDTGMPGAFSSVDGSSAHARRASSSAAAPERAALTPERQAALNRSLVETARRGDSDAVDALIEAGAQPRVLVGLISQQGARAPDSGRPVAALPYRGGPIVVVENT
jgi:hypothetical protein